MKKKYSHCAQWQRVCNNEDRISNLQVRFECLVQWLTKSQVTAEIWSSQTVETVALSRGSGQAQQNGLELVHEVYG